MTRDGIAVRVEICRLAEGDRSWTLEVVDHNLNNNEIEIAQTAS